jgi:hypothetical protein
MTNQPVTTHRFLGATAAVHDPRTGDGFGTWAGIAFGLGVLARLDDRDLDDLGLGRADLPGIARRHARAAVG